LGLEQTLTLFFIVQPYLPKDKNLSHYDACSLIFDAMTPDEFFDCIRILTGTEKNMIIREDALEYFVAFVEGMQLNNILSLHDLFTKIGFIV